MQDNPTCLQATHLLFSSPLQKPNSFPNASHCSESKQGEKKYVSLQTHINRLWSCPFTRYLPALPGGQAAPSDPRLDPSVRLAGALWVLTSFQHLGCSQLFDLAMLSSDKAHQNQGKGTLALTVCTSALKIFH